MTCAASCTEPEFVPLTSAGRGGGGFQLMSVCARGGLSLLLRVPFLPDCALPGDKPPLEGQGLGARGLSRRGGSQPPFGCLRGMLAKSLELFEASSAMLLFIVTVQPLK